MPYKTPVISDVQPATLFTAGGTVLTIDGENFNGGTTITVAGKECAILKLVGTTKLTCVAPSSADGTFEVVVTQLNGKEAKSAVAYDGLAFTTLGILAGRLVDPMGSNLDGYYTAADSRGASQMIYENNLIYSADSDGYKIKETNLATLYSKTLIASGYNGTEDIAVLDPVDAVITSPTCLAKTGNIIYFCISDISIGKLDTSTGVLSHIAGYLPADPASYSLPDPRGYTLDGVRQIYLSGNSLIVVDRDTIKKIDLVTPSLTTIAGTAGAGAIVDGAGAVATFDYISRSALINDQLYVDDYVDYYTKVLRKVDLSSAGNYTVTTVVGDPLVSIYYEDAASDGIGAAASLTDISGMTVYGEKLLLLDTYQNGNYKIRLFDPASTEITTLFSIPATSNTVLGDISTKANMHWNTRGILYITGYGLIFGNEYGLLRLQ